MLTWSSALPRASLNATACTVTFGNLRLSQAALRGTGSNAWWRPSGASVTSVCRNDPMWQPMSIAFVSRATTRRT